MSCPLVALAVSCSLSVVANANSRLLLMSAFSCVCIVLVRSLLVLNSHPQASLRLGYDLLRGCLGLLFQRGFILCKLQVSGWFLLGRNFVAACQEQMQQSKA